MSITGGTRLGRYEIRSQLGAGGMGEVYLAQDTHLRRPAALKILPARFTESEDRLRRFEREACAASALNHPNIITIHEIGHEDSLHFMAMEFVDGETLRARMNRSALALREALDIAIQVADALAAAHEAGIVHRDIKPENIMIRRDGYVKVLDFGLAKLTERETSAVDSQAPTIAKADTEPGTIMGTMQYMSPEQARAKEVDKRTDIWSLGVVLYEMVAGQPPFAGETRSDMLVALLSQEPPSLSQQSSEVPAELERIVRKALQKNRDERYQTVKDLSLDLKSLRRERDVNAEMERSAAPNTSGAARAAAGSDTRATTTKGSRVSIGSLPTTNATRDVESPADESLKGRIKRQRRAVSLVVAALLITAGVVLLLKFFGQSKPETLAAALFRKTESTRLTTNGNTRVAAISPDGKYVAYAMDESGKQSLWLRQVTISSNVRLLPLAESNYFACAFSPDGDFIYYAMEDRQTQPAVYKLPVLGGSPTKVIGDLSGPVAPSPDGRQMAVVTIDKMQDEVVLSIANTDGSDPRKLMTRRGYEHFDWIAWSPDGKSLICPVITFSATDPHVTMLEVAAADGALKTIGTYKWIAASQPAWLPDKSGIVLIARDQVSPFDQIWLVSYTDGAARKITNDLFDYRGVSLSVDARSLVSVQMERVSNVWISKSDRDGSSTQIAPGVGTYYDIAHTIDGKILYASDASGSADIWEMENSGVNQKQLTAGAGRNYAPVASPDGRYIVFHSNRSGIWQVWRMDRNGNNPKQLTTDSTDSNWPQVSPDGQWVVYQHIDTSETTLWKIPIDGGAPVRLTEQLSGRAAISPDGKLIACWQFNSTIQRRVELAVVPFSGGQAIRTFDLGQSALMGLDAMLKWTPDGKALTYVERRAGVDNIWKLPLDGGPPTQFTTFNDNQIFAFDWLGDGRLICSRGFKTGDAVLLRDAR
ncbi:MAG TPA: protein kinase [Pyrinomonadaceae bacterium]